MLGTPGTRLEDSTRVQRLLAIIAVVALLALIALLDRTTGLFHLTMLYVVPIVVATSAFGLVGGMLTAAVALIEVVTTHSLQHSSTLVADISTDFVMFLFVAIVIDRLRAQLMTIRALEARRDYELGVARDVQSRMLAQMPADDRFEVAGALHFAREVGGDYYRFDELRGDLFLCAGDISGKGMSAALFAMLLDEAIRDGLRTYDGLSSFVEELNRRMYDSMPSEMFVTMFIAAFDDDAISFVNCGHVRPLLFEARTRRITELSAAGTMPLGVSDTIPVQQAVLRIAPGDTLLICSDGVTESPSVSREPESLVAAFEQSAESGPQAVVDRVTTLARSEGQTDDVTVLCVRRR